MDTCNSLNYGQMMLCHSHSGFTDLPIPEYSSLISNLAEVIPKEMLLVGKPVIQIPWNGSFASEDGFWYPVREMVEDGDYFLADHIIAIVSLGKINNTSFKILL